MKNKRAGFLAVGLLTLSAVLAGRASAANFLTPTDVGNVISRVVQEATARGTPATIVVVDRMGAVLAIYTMTNAPNSFPVENNPKGPNATLLVDALSGLSLPNTAAVEAITKADTAAYLSTSGGNAFSTRTASQIIQDHFNPGTLYAPSGPLYGVQFSQLPCSDLMVRVVPGGDPTALTRGPHRSPLGMAGDPGGFPLYKNGEMVGGVGVKAAGPYRVDENIYDNDHSTDEILALAGTIGLDAPTSIRADHISAGGLLLRYSDATPSDFKSKPASAPAYAKIPAGRGALTSVASYYDASAGLRTGSVYGTAAAGLMPIPTPKISTAEAPYLLVDGSGNPRYPARAGSGAGALTQAETTAILNGAFGVAIKTRAQIRNPPGSTARVTISVVDVYGQILGVATTPDAPNFGIDVSLQKARTALFMSSTNAGAFLTSAGLGKFTTAETSFYGSDILSSGYAWSARATGNASRDTYPDGIDGSPNGPFAFSAKLTTPFSDGLQLDLVIGNIATHALALIDDNLAADTPAYCTGLPAPAGSPTGLPILANGSQIFPGGFPIYRGSQLIGGIGISGDGVDQDDMIGFLGLYNAGVALKSGVGHAPPAIRIDRIVAHGVAAHYVNCPFAPFVNSNSQNVCANK